MINNPISILLITIGEAHIRNINHASPKRIRKMAATAVHKACVKMRSQGARPITLVDDLSMHSPGKWIDAFAQGLTSAAKYEGISIIGGEMAQMADTYLPNSVSVVVYVTGLK
jgi:phosphoribosylaminoimidazole (AIR) synthetase